MNAARFELQVDDEAIVGDVLGEPQQLRALFLHGAGQSDRQRQRLLREDLAHAGFGSLALDFSGHGESSANSPGSLKKRLRQAQCMSAHADADRAIRTVVGTSMSGEIALRLACESGSRIDHVILIVGAIYDRAAFPLPFGPEFSGAIRRPQSWRHAETLELIRGYRGGLTLIRALDDAVIPHEVADLLEQAAVSARFRRIIDLPATDHRVSEKMANDAALRQRIAAAIKTEDWK
ncbi:alpha/beta fold hydrolase [Herbaspirillum rhizosphaerae]|uniref:alpha/beta fold hydrolase n=1 Tax=Herbaspirillum rhizosphaerae TaxID=346179 RepID=UPI00067A7DEA|nr:alpha/beta hydrolase [Herbaspirillum rhizosphaerae]